MTNWTEKRKQKTELLSHKHTFFGVVIRGHVIVFIMIVTLLLLLLLTSRPLDNTRFLGRIRLKYQVSR